MDSRIVHVNPAANIVEKLHFHDDGSITHQVTQDETALVEENKAIRNQTSSLDRWGEGRVVLRGVPFPLLEEWRKRGWLEKDQFWRALADERSVKYKVFGK
jgi:hypothetical protein